MRFGAAMLMLASLGACGQEQAAPTDDGEASHSPARHDQGGRIVDLANALEPAAKAELARRLREEQQADGRPVVVILVEQGEGESLEQLGWAVRGRDGSGAGPFLLLLDTASRRARLEGDLQPEQKARVVRAMEPALRSGNHAAAVSAGLTELERLAP